MTAPLVRPARLEDAEALGEIAERAWELTYRGVIPDSVLREWTDGARASWRKALETAEPDTLSRRWVADLNGSVAGYATTAPGGDQWLASPGVPCPIVRFRGDQLERR